MGTGENAMPRKATNQAIFRRLAAVSTRDFQMRYGMPGAATANNTGQNNNVVVIRSSINSVLAHAEVLEKDVNPRTAFDRKSVTPMVLAATRKLFPIVLAQRALGALGKSQTNCHRASVRKASQYSGSRNRASVEN